jgi:nucleotide-binding universal stress UspA family protein
MSNTRAGHAIVVGVDGSASALHAALWAADEAAQRKRPLRLVFAGDSLPFGNGVGLAPPQSYFDAIRVGGEQLLVAAETAIRRQHPGLEIHLELLTAAAVPTLIEQTRDARLLVLGSRGSGGFRGILVGSTAVALVAYGHCPVAVIRGRTPEAAPPVDGPVVVGVDGSATSDAAIAASFDEASWRNAALVAVLALDDATPQPVYSHQTPAARKVAEQNGHELLAERLAGWQDKYPDVVVRRVLTRAQPVEALLDNAADAQLIVVGSRGHGGFAGAILGSTSQALIYHAGCPLLVVRPTGGA